jgi:hypothetical protein
MGDAMDRLEVRVAFRTEDLFAVFFQKHEMILRKPMAMDS